MDGRLLTLLALAGIAGAKAVRGSRGIVRAGLASGVLPSFALQDWQLTAPSRRRMGSRKLGWWTWPKKGTAPFTDTLIWNIHHNPPHGFYVEGKVGDGLWHPWKKTFDTPEAAAEAVYHYALELLSRGTVQLHGSRGVVRAGRSIPLAELPSFHVVDWQDTPPSQRRKGYRALGWLTWPKAGESPFTTPASWNIHSKGFPLRVGGPVQYFVEQHLGSRAGNRSATSFKETFHSIEAAALAVESRVREYVSSGQLQLRERGSRGIVRAGRPAPEVIARFPMSIQVKQSTRKGNWSLVASVHPFGRGGFGMTFYRDGAVDGRATTAKSNFLREIDAKQAAFAWADEGKEIFGGRPGIVRIGPQKGEKVLSSGDPGTGVPVEIRAFTHPSTETQSVWLAIQTAEHRWERFRPDVVSELIVQAGQSIGPAVADLRERFPIFGREIPVVGVSVGVWSGSRNGARSQERGAGSQQPGGVVPPRSPLIASRSHGSRGIVRKGPSPVPTDLLAERFFRDAGYSHPADATETEILQIRQAHGRDLANAWRALQDDESGLQAIWDLDDDTSELDAEQLTRLSNGEFELLSLRIVRVDPDSGRATETLDSQGGITIQSADHRLGRWERELYEAEMALGLGIGTEDGPS